MGKYKMYKWWFNFGRNLKKLKKVLTYENKDVNIIRHQAKGKNFLKYFKKYFKKIQKKCWQISTTVLR